MTNFNFVPFNQSANPTPGIASEEYATADALLLKPEGKSRKKIRVQIPPQYNHSPVISTLAIKSHLEVNILGALLPSNFPGSGWFDLELRGTPSQIDEGIHYLTSLDVEIVAEEDPSSISW